MIAKGNSLRVQFYVFPLQVLLRSINYLQTNPAWIVLRVKRNSKRHNVARKALDVVSLPLHASVKS